jgi:hypothetical protein
MLVAGNSKEWAQSAIAWAVGQIAITTPSIEGMG